MALIKSVFQSTPPRRRRLSGMTRIFHDDVFNPRLREGGDRRTKSSSRREKFFNPRLREGGDGINSHFLKSTSCIFQSTPPRRRRQAAGKVEERRRWFSIHASAKEATTERTTSAGNHIFSIHASAKEATATYCNTPAIMCISSLNNFFVHHF